MHLPLGVAVTARHILPHDDSLAVAIGVPRSRLHLDVLANHVEAPLFCLVDVENHCLIARCRVETIGPPALVERTKLEEVLVVELHAHNAIVVALGRNLAHCSIALHAVNRLSVFIYCHLKVVEEWAVGRPELGVLGHAHLHRLIVDATGSCHKLAAIEHLHLSHHSLTFHRLLHRDGNGVGIHVGKYAQILNVHRCHRLNPHCLPDAAHRSVPYSIGIAHLLASGLVASVGRIPHTHCECILSGFQRLRNVE